MPVHWEFVCVSTGVGTGIERIFQDFKILKITYHEKTSKTKYLKQYSNCRLQANEQIVSHFGIM